MKRTLPLLVSLVAASAANTALAAEEGRFDAQIFRPSAAPRDLVMIQKSEVIGHLSPVFGFYSDISIDPLAIASITTGNEISAVGARLQITGLAGIGFYDWFDVTLAMPFIGWQTGENLRQLGSEGPVQSTALGDLRFGTKIAIPYFNRKEKVQSGLGLAITGNINLPTGNQDAFASDGAVTGGAGLVADYRFGFGLLVSANGGVWLRPDRQFAGTKVGDMANFGLGAEMYVVQRWGWSVLGGVFGHASLSKFPDSPAQVPAEALLAMRFQTDSGFTFTVGGAFGANCGFGAPVFRAFGGIMWTPATSREQEQITRIKRIDSEDPDKDNVTGTADKCPDKPGTPENSGCPPEDADQDGTVDKDDKCPKLAGGREGCPVAYRKDDEIVVMDPVHFATDKDIILETSKPVLDQVVAVMLASPDIRELEIEGHTDIRASDAYNFTLSQRRVESVRNYMIAKGIDPSVLTARGYGHSKPLFDDTACNAPDEKLSEDCKYMTSKNRRVVFRIKRYGAPQSRSLDGGAPILGPSGGSGLPAGGSLGSQSPLGGSDSVFPAPKSGPVLPSGGSALPSGGGALPSSGGSSGLPSGGGALPSSGGSSGLPSSGGASGLPSSSSVLPSSTPKPPPKPVEAPKKPAPPAAPAPAKPPAQK